MNYNLLPILVFNSAGDSVALFPFLLSSTVEEVAGFFAYTGSFTTLTFASLATFLEGAASFTAFYFNGFSTDSLAYDLVAVFLAAFTESFFEACSAAFDFSAASASFF